ncbi:family 10 glycosylhydrolase [Candidatus Poribacteria bacterium]|nr:family 10 glycosylhydrolase [Candidatus Poribacteria bacterium]MYH79343.1 family 10 glycosylhydrolase [Candidatus Poribacteria bacterium]MYK95841.1 family 10 glycosylhydrolase [Candidatus Poribacteria bacterium]
MLFAKFASQRLSYAATIVILVCLLSLCSGGLNLTVAQQAEIAIVLPKKTPQVSEGDVQYARSVAKRFNRMLNGIGLTAATLEEASLSEAQLKSRRLVILPLNPVIAPKTAGLLNSFVANGGKLFVTYTLSDTVAPLLGLRQTNWLKQEAPGHFASIQLNAPDILDMPVSIRQASWNITVAEPTTPDTEIIGYWHNANGESTGLPALSVGKSGVFFSHIFLPDDIQRKMQMLAALLGHLVPEFRRTFAKQAIATMTTIGHTKDFTELKQFVQQSDVPEANEALKTGTDLMNRARVEYDAEAYNTAITVARASRAEFSKAYFLSHGSVETEGRAVWNHSGLGAYPGDWERSAQELASAGVNIVLPNMAWAGVAHYPSKILPQSKTFTRYGDQIAQCVEAAHNHSLEVHVWKITWNLEGAPKEFVEKIRAEGRTQVSATGQALNWLCPSHPKNVLLEVESSLEIVANYDVDGIHLDYIRYPGSHACYCDGCRQRFVLATRLQIDKWPAAVLPKTGTHSEKYIEWRAQQITRLVRLLHKRLREADPKIKISAAVFGWYPGCITTIGQDWIAWAKAGYVDFVCPMNYTESTDYFTELLVNQLALMPKDVAIYPGIGATASNSLLTPDAVVEQIYLSRNLGASGWTIFDYSLDISETVLPAFTIGVTKRKAKPPH